MNPTQKVPIHWRNASLALALDIMVGVLIVVIINDPESFWRLPTVVVALWLVPWIFRIKSGLYFLLNYQLNESKLVLQQMREELTSKAYPCPGPHYDLAEDYFSEVATDDNAPIDARLSAAKYLGADAAWGQTQQVLTRWLFNRAALTVIARHREALTGGGI